MQVDTKLTIKDFKIECNERISPKGNSWYIYVGGKVKGRKLNTIYILNNGSLSFSMLKENNGLGYFETEQEAIAMLKSENIINELKLFKNYINKRNNTSDLHGYINYKSPIV